MFIIAEVGSNFRDKQDCLNSIALAAQCGASAVKFQLYNYKSLYGFDCEAKGQLEPNWLPDLKIKADACKIQLMCSAFSPELAEIVNQYVDTHKVASAELTHVRLLQKLNSFRKPVILSTGASGMADIDIALTVLKDCDVTLLYCVSAYPARYVNFSKMFELIKFGKPVGFSDHTTDILNIPDKAQDIGANVLEKHVNFVGATGPDAPHSLTTDEFKYMVKRLRHEKVPLELNEENPMRLRHNRRLIATQDIKPGDTLTEGVNFGIYRSLHDDTEALSPWAIDNVNGKTCKIEIKAGYGIGPKAI